MRLVCHHADLRGWLRGWRRLTTCAVPGDRERRGVSLKGLEITERVNELQRQMLGPAARRPHARNELAERRRDGGPDGGGPGAGPPVGGHSRRCQAWAVAAPTLLPESSEIADMLADYAEMRELLRSTLSPRLMLVS